MPRIARQVVVPIVAVLLATAAHPARAQLAPVFQYDRGSDVSGAATSGVGAGFQFPLNKWTQQHGMTGVFTFDYFFADDFTIQGKGYSQTFWEVNMDGTWDLPGTRGIVFIGTGLNFVDQSVHYTGNVPNVIGSNLGLNLLAGLKAGGKKHGVFLQGRAELGGGKQFVATAGVYF